MSSFYQELDDWDFFPVLSSSLAKSLLGHDDDGLKNVSSWQNFGNDWTEFISRRASHLIEFSNGSAPSLEKDLFSIGVAALNSFLQCNVTGPPLTWNSHQVILPQALQTNPNQLKELRHSLILTLSIDGETVYHLTPKVELFCLAKTLLNHVKIVGKDPNLIWGRLRVNSWHQRMLSENVDSLQKTIYNDLETIGWGISNQSSQAGAQYLIERATIHTHHGFDKKAREDLKSAAEVTGLRFALTGRLGKRTKFQQNDLSQLVVLAVSASDKNPQNVSSDELRSNDVNDDAKNAMAENASKPVNLDLNDDTLLETISFSKESPVEEILDEEIIPQALKTLDPADQPTLKPLDSIILLAVASSISNTSPQDGLTREETLPYATRVLTGGSTNWQVYTQGLLVRSRIEGYRSRTVERGVLQLQALVDQVIAETTSEPATEVTDLAYQEPSPSTTTFLPKAKASDSAPVSERLLYIHQLAPPTRWKLEAELADRWVSLGGLRTALEIYERLQMWAEVALCWAASDREDEARKIIRNQLYETLENEDVASVERSPLPADAPRLFCILGDIDKAPSCYDRAWEVSRFRYARAQRSLGRHYVAKKDLPRADEAYTKSLKISPQKHETWFALGCVRLEMENWTGAIEAFGRAIQIEEKDAESWSNLAAALLRLPPPDSLANNNHPTNNTLTEDDDSKEQSSSSSSNPQKHIQEAFFALKRAAVLKRDSYRIWQNLLNVAVRLSRPPYSEIIIAQTRLIELLSNVEGEKCIDIPVLEGLFAQLIASSSSSSSDSHPEISIPESSANPLTEDYFLSTTTQSTLHIRKAGFPRMLIDLIQNKVTPLITTSPRLWLLTAKLHLHLARPLAALTAYEKAWRATLNSPSGSGWESCAGAGSTENEKWTEVVNATIDLADAYESLGERKRESGLGMGEALVCKEWKFKARSAVRGVMGRARDGWEGTEGWERLVGRLAELKVG